MHAWVRRWWSGGGGWPGALLSGLLRPLEWGYAAVVVWRGRRFDRTGGTRVPGVWVVSVGNLSVGGTGKTPLASWAVDELTASGRSVAVVARGYGRDELRLHQRWHPDVPVIADADRVAGTLAARSAGADAVVLDDGFQHRRLARDVDLVLVSAEDPVPGRLLPVGPYREPWTALERAHAVVVTRRTASAAEAAAVAADVEARLGAGTPVGRVALLPGGWRSLSDGPAEGPEGPILVATAVARPEAVAAHVAATGAGPVELAAYPDHHDFGEGDARAIRARAGGRPVAVTEKDAVKLDRFADILGDVRVLLLHPVWEHGRDEVAAVVAGTGAP